jgi:Arc/MetJ-type ribon-helix-helix transcriptional regulator
VSDDTPRDFFTSDFSISIRGEIDAFENPYYGTYELIVRLFRQTPEKPQGETLGIFGLQFPPEDFKSAEHFTKWAEAVRDAFTKKIEQTVREELRLHFHDVASLCLDRLRIERIDSKEIIANHIEQTKARVRKNVGARGRGQPSKWTKRELSQAVRAALAAFPKMERTQENAAKRLRDMEPYKEKAPPTGGALRILLKRHELKWEEVQPVR